MNETLAGFYAVPEFSKEESKKNLEKNPVMCEKNHCREPR